MSIEVSMSLTKLNEFSQVGGSKDIAREMERGRIGESVERFTWEGRTAEDARGMANYYEIVSVRLDELPKEVINMTQFAAVMSVVLDIHNIHTQRTSL